MRIIGIVVYEGTIHLAFCFTDVRQLFICKIPYPWFYLKLKLQNETVPLKRISILSPTLVYIKQHFVHCVSS